MGAYPYRFALAVAPKRSGTFETTQQIRRAVHRSTRGLEDAIRGCIATKNEAPKPFI